MPTANQILCANVPNNFDISYYGFSSTTDEVLLCGFVWDLTPFTASEGRLYASIRGRYTGGAPADPTIRLRVGGSFYGQNGDSISGDATDGDILLSMAVGSSSASISASATVDNPSVVWGSVVQFKFTIPPTNGGFDLDDAYVSYSE
jgi:hypothetical protein